MGEDAAATAAATEFANRQLHLSKPNPKLCNLTSTKVVA
jgi:hypothetical protein